MTEAGAARPRLGTETIDGADVRLHSAAGDGHFVIAAPGTDWLLGEIDVAPLADHTGRVSFSVEPWARGRGVATAAVRALTEHALAAGYARMEMRTEFANTTAQRVALAAGYTREGVARAATTDGDGTRQDVIVWARVVGDPPGPVPRYLPDLPGGELTDGVVRLSPMTAGDAAEVHPVRCAPDVVANTVTRAVPTPAETAEYCARAGAVWLAGQGVRLTVRDAATGAFAGKAGLTVEDPGSGQAEIDYYLAAEWRGRGYARRAVQLLCRWAFRHTGLERLVAGVHPENDASRHVLERCGFVLEARERGRLPDGSGGRTDVVTYALLG